MPAELPDDLTPEKRTKLNTARPLGAATYTFLYASGLHDALRSLAETGLRLVELTAAPPHVHGCALETDERLMLRRLADQLGIQLISLNPTYLDLNVASLNRSIREERLRQLTAGLQLCHDHEIGIFVLFARRRHVLAPAPIDVVERVLLDGLEILLGRVTELGVTVGLENGPTLLLEHGADVARICATVQHPKLRAVFDAANSFMVEDPVEGLQPLLPHIALVHLSDTTRDRWAHAPVGDGAVDFKAIASVLDIAGYTGPTILEVIDLASPVTGLERSVSQLSGLGWAIIAE